MAPSCPPGEGLGEGFEGLGMDGVGGECQRNRRNALGRLSIRLAPLV